MMTPSQGNLSARLGKVREVNRGLIKTSEDQIVFINIKQILVWLFVHNLVKL